jgi:thioredoxin-related protein
MFFSLLLSFESGAVESDVTLNAGMTNPGYKEKPEWFKNSFLDLREDVNEATANNKRVLLYFYQDGCPYCAKLLRDNFSQKSISDKTQKYFDVIAINMWGDREVTGLDGNSLTEKTFAEKMRVMFTPTIIILDESAKQKLRINGYYYPEKFSAALDYSKKGGAANIRFSEFFKSRDHQPASGKIHQAEFLLKPPYNLKALLKDNKPLLVLFEQKVCKACDEQHADIFKRKETLEQLRRFNIVRLNMWAKTSLIDEKGHSTTAINYARSHNINYAPSMVFFDNNGAEVFRLEAYLKSFHIQSSLDYVASAAYLTQPNFQRYIAKRTDKIEAQGGHVDLWN